eukprot:750989-Hanusia_phi.AAC.1
MTAPPVPLCPPCLHLTWRSRSASKPEGHPDGAQAPLRCPLVLPCCSAMSSLPADDAKEGGKAKENVKGWEGRAGEKGWKRRRGERNGGEEGRGAGGESHLSRKDKDEMRREHFPRSLLVSLLGPETSVEHGDEQDKRNQRGDEGEEDLSDEQPMSTNPLLHPAHLTRH